MKRRNFLKAVLSTGILMQIPWYLSCNQKTKYVSLKNEVLNNKQREIILFLLEKLFPENKNIPSIFQLNTYTHINNFLLDKNIDSDEKKYFINGIKWTQETANEQFNKSFNELNSSEKINLFHKILQESWGESWFSRILTLIFESLLLDPIYDINKNEIGWKYLNHISGKPRPNINNKYKILLERKKHTSIITNINQLI